MGQGQLSDAFAAFRAALVDEGANFSYGVASRLGQALDTLERAVFEALPRKADPEPNPISIRLFGEDGTSALIPDPRVLTDRERIGQLEEAQSRFILFVEAADRTLIMLTRRLCELEKQAQQRQGALGPNVVTITDQRALSSAFAGVLP